MEACQERVEAVLVSGHPDHLLSHLQIRADAGQCDRNLFGTEWVGLHYFQMFFKDSAFWRAFYNLYLSVVYLIFRFPLTLTFALLLLKFITGQEDIEKGWDAYVAQAKASGSDRYTQMANDIFNKTKSTLGY